VCAIGDRSSAGAGATRAGAETTPKSSAGLVETALVFDVRAILNAGIAGGANKTASTTSHSRCLVAGAEGMQRQRSATIIAMGMAMIAFRQSRSVPMNTASIGPPSRGSVLRFETIDQLL
jgi:hypothetical protein